MARLALAECVFGVLALESEPVDPPIRKACGQNKRINNPPPLANFDFHRHSTLSAGNDRFECVPGSARRDFPKLFVDVVWWGMGT